MIAMQTQISLFPEYKFVSRQQISDKKLLLFCKKTYFKAFHILTGVVVYKKNIQSGIYFPEPENYRLFRTDSKNYPLASNEASRYLSLRYVPCILPLPQLKGFIRNMVKQSENKYIEYDYIEVTLEEALAAYGLLEDINRIKQLLLEENERSKDINK